MKLYKVAIVGMYCIRQLEFDIQPNFVELESCRLGVRASVGTAITVTALSGPDEIKRGPRGRTISKS
jgi:hypothetical protein